MKVLHTSDWHLGKRLPPFNREREQKAALLEIRDIAQNENADVCIIAGDVFDVSVPPATAEELFYNGALEIAKICPVVAIAGNHDDGERLKAPDALAKANGIYLAGGFDCSPLSYGEMQARAGGLIFRKNGERLNIALCPYLTESRRGDAPADDFSAYVKGVLAQITDSVFSDDGCNILVAHLFMTGSVSGEERELGAAKLLPPDVLPKCDYVALGHVHKPMKVAENAYYSGSILVYSFDKTPRREVIIFDTVTKEIKHIPLSSGYEMRTVTASSYAAALEELQSAGDAYVRLIYDCAVPLTAAQTSELERAGKLVQLEVISHEQKRESIKRAHRTPSQLFEEFCAVLNGGEKPDGELTGEFLSLIGEDA